MCIVISTDYLGATFFKVFIFVCIKSRKYMLQILKYLKMTHDYTKYSPKFLYAGFTKIFFTLAYDVYIWIQCT
jgi:hypothetical protein